MPKDILLQEALKAIDRLFSDRAVSVATTRERLEEVHDEIDIKLASLR